MDRANALEEELRNLGNKLSRTEDEHRRTQEQLQVSIFLTNKDKISLIQILW